MKKRFLYSTVFALVCIVVAGTAYMYRTPLRHAIEDANKPQLPAPIPFNATATNEVKGGGDAVSPVQGGVATSSNYILVTSPTTLPGKADPFAENGALPASKNLDVPFMSQAPTGDWAQPYQDACEEASVIMVDAFYRGKGGRIASAEAVTAIEKLVAYQNKTFGDYKDTDAAETAKMIKEHFGYTEVLVVPYDTAKMKRAIANGFPVIIPADGKLLMNPNFRNGGPPYHMLVAKGYTGDKIITNDPGTSRGADYVYAAATLQKAAHDWNDGDVRNGKQLMLVVIPKQR